MCSCRAQIGSGTEPRAAHPRSKVGWFPATLHIPRGRHGSTCPPDLCTGWGWMQAVRCGLEHPTVPPSPWGLCGWVGRAWCSRAEQGLEAGCCCCKFCATVARYPLLTQLTPSLMPMIANRQHKGKEVSLSLAPRLAFKVHRSQCSLSIEHWIRLLIGFCLERCQELLNL